MLNCQTPHIQTVRLNAKHKKLMTEKQLKLLDFILPRLSEIYPNSSSLSSLTHEYKKQSGIEFDYKEEKHIIDLYNYQYFEFNEITNDYIKITPEYKEIIDRHGSLTNYLKEQNDIEKENQKFDDELKMLQVENARLENENLKLQNKHLRRYILYAIVGFIAGVIVTNWKEILFLLRITSPE